MNIKFDFYLQSNSSSPKTSSRSNVHTTSSSNSTETNANNSKSFSSDLLGLTTTSASTGNGIDPKTSNDNNDVFGCFFSNSTIDSTQTHEKTVESSTDVTNSTTTTTVTSLAQEEQDFFNQVPTEKEKTKLTNDSILALYGKAPTISQFASVGGPNVGINQTSNHTAFVSQMTAFNNPNQMTTNNMMFSGNLPTQYPTPSNTFCQMGGLQQSQQQQSIIGNHINFDLQNVQQTNLMAPSTTGAGVTVPTTAFNSFGYAMPLGQFNQQNPNLIANNANGHSNVTTTTTTNAANNLSQQIGNLNLNVWQ